MRHARRRAPSCAHAAILEVSSLDQNENEDPPTVHENGAGDRTYISDALDTQVGKLLTGGRVPHGLSQRSRLPRGYAVRCVTGVSWHGMAKLLIKFQLSFVNNQQYYNHVKQARP